MACGRPAASGRVAFGGVHQKGEQGVARIRAAQFFANRRVAQQPRDPGQGLEMVGPGRFRRQQQKDQIDRLLVHRIEIDRLVQAGEDAVKAVKTDRFAVRNGDAVADARRAQALALQQRVEDGALVDPGQRRRGLRQFLQSLFL